MKARGPWIGAAVLAGIALIALAAPWLAPFDPRTQHDILTLIWQAPGGAHLLGTDSASRDVLSRLLHGTRTTLSVAVLAVVVSIAVGTLVGSAAAVLRGTIDAVLMRFTDAMLAMPRLLLLILIVAGTDEGFAAVPLAIVIGVTGWMTTARLVRQETRRVLATEFVRGARAVGVPRRRLVARHVLPALAPVIAAAAVFAFASAVPLETGLSFLGLGVSPPEPSWGNIIADAESRPLTRWWLVAFPVAAIITTVLAANAIGERVARRMRDGEA